MTKRWTCLECGTSWDFPVWVNLPKYDGEVTCWACKRLNTFAIRDGLIVNQSLSDAGYALNPATIKAILHRAAFT